MLLLRQYDTYSHYIAHQKEKTLDPARRKKWLGEEWTPKLEAFKKAFKKTLGEDLSGKKCLAVCARTGQEVQALRDLGGDAIGVDLVPCPPLVIYGDMHNLPFGDKQFDIVFSNSLDHSWIPDKFLDEMMRVTKPKGLALFHLQVGYRCSRCRPRQGYDICEIDDSSEVSSRFVRSERPSEILINRKISCLSSNWELLIQVGPC